MCHLCVLALLLLLLLLRVDVRVIVVLVVLVVTTKATRPKCVLVSCWVKSSQSSDSFHFTFRILFCLLCIFFPYGLG